MSWVGITKRSVAYTACGLVLAVANMFLGAGVALAAPSYTPYANSVAAQSGVDSGTANNAVGAPDGQTASLLGNSSSLTLDMGAGEEGTGSLKLYLGPVNLQAQVSIAFLDDAQGVIKTEQRQLFFDLSASEQTFAYDWQSFNKAYRFVRVSSTFSVALGVDSVEALGFIGSSTTQDTDGDGTPDRKDPNPLKPDEQSTGGGGGGSSSTGGSGGSSGGTQTVVRTNITNSTRSGSTPAVNGPATAANDKDGDQMDDAWELKYGLDPTNRADGQQDADKDKLTNVMEYQFDTNPRLPDTDNDGITDGWEVAHGLNAKVDDANEDPDFDYVNNRGEAFMDANPYVADTFASLAAKLDARPRLLSMLLWVVLLVVALMAWWRMRRLIALVARRRSAKRSGKKRGSRGKSSLPPL